MKICKLITKEIDLNGTAIPDELQDHLGQCETCNQLFQDQQKVEALFANAEEPVVPPYFKLELLKKARLGETKTYRLPKFVFALRAAALVFIVFLGFWLGMNSANRSLYTPQRNFDLVKSQPYKMIVESVNSQNLGEIYFTVMQGAKNE